MNDELCEEKLKSPKVVYLIKATDGLVRLGATLDFDVTIPIIARQAGKVIEKTYHTEICSNYAEIISRVKKNIGGIEYPGQWYDVSFDDAVAILNETFETNKKYIKDKEINVDDAVQCFKKMWFPQKNIQLTICEQRERINNLILKAKTDAQRQAIEDLFYDILHR